jgi:hypothetical protein
MTRERALTKLELVPAYVSGKRGWVQARWERADGSGGDVTVQPRLKTAERWYIARLLVSVPTSELLRDVPLARIESAVNADVNADPQMRQWVESGTDEETLELARREASRRPKLKRPGRRRLDDKHYQRVAAAYKGAVAHGLHPSKTLAAESDTPPGTVNRWIAEARKRGYLPPGATGRVTV